MCGIFAQIGHFNLRDSLKCLKLLEYRGYDSYGYCYKDQNKLVVKKDIGQIKSDLKDFDTTLFIGHTRWATNGDVSILNCHPHFSSNKKVCLVHNGVILNYEELTKSYLKDVHFYGKTDSEVIANLLEKLLKDNSPLESIKKLSELMIGSYAFVFYLYDDKLYYLKNNAPLVVAKSKEGFKISSDIYSTREDLIYSIENNDYGYVTKDFFFSAKKKVHFKKIKKEDLYLQESKMMLKEILEIPSLIKNMKKDNELLEFKGRLIILGCGTSFHSGLIIKRIFESVYHKEARIVLASEFYEEPIKLNELDKVLMISQSGETMDLILCMPYLKNNEIIVLTNELYSTLASYANKLIFMEAYKELAVASTKSYFMSILKMNSYFRNYNYENFILNIEKIINEKDKIKDFAYKLLKYNKILIIGKKNAYDIALEAALKIKEISYKICECYPSGELKHGSIALVDKDTFIISLRNKDQYNSNANYIEALSRAGGGTELILNDELYGIDIILFFDLLAYYMSSLLGYNPDRPRNLAKSITVV